MLPIALSEILAVGDFPSAQGIAILAQAGFRALIDNQPDGEVDRLPSAQAVATAAAACGMGFRHLPLESRHVSEADVAAFAAAMTELPRPIYAFCYSGARSAAAWALASAHRLAPETIVAACAKAGFDMSALLPGLDERWQRAVAAAAGTAPCPATPMLTRTVLYPRAASAGGYAM